MLVPRLVALYIGDHARSTLLLELYGNTTQYCPWFEESPS